jgi:hypothetical protein
VKKLSKILIISILAVLLAVGSASATAILALTVEHLGNRIIHDNGSWDTNPNLGVVSWSGSIMDWNVNISTGLSKDVLGSATWPILDLNSVNTGGTGTLRVSFSDTDFTGSGLQNYNHAIGGTTDGTIATKSYFDLGNTAFAHTTLIADLGTLGSGPFAGTDVGTFDLGVGTSTYSLTLLVDITHGVADGITSFDTELQASPVPEPTTMLLLGTGLVGLAGFGRKKFKK